MKRLLPVFFLLAALFQLGYAQSFAVGIAVNRPVIANNSGSSATTSLFGFGGHLEYLPASWVALRASLDYFGDPSGNIIALNLGIPFRLGGSGFAFYIGPTFGHVNISASNGSGSANGFGLLLGIEGYVTDSFGLYWDGQATSLPGGALGFGHLGVKFRF